MCHKQMWVLTDQLLEFKYFITIFIALTAVKSDLNFGPRFPEQGGITRFSVLSLLLSTY